MKYLYIIEKGQEIFSAIKKVEEVVTDEDTTIKQYKDANGEIQRAYPTKVFCYETENEAREKIISINAKDEEKEIEKLNEEYNKKVAKIKKKYSPIIVVDTIINKPLWEQELNKNGFYFLESEDTEEYELINKEAPKSIIFLMSCDSSEDLKEMLIKECNYHLQMIEDEDEDYFDDCDEKYLKGEWKKLVQKILDIVKKD